MPDGLENTPLPHTCAQQIQDLETRVVQQVDGLRKEFTEYKDSMTKDFDLLKKRQEEIAGEIGDKIVVAFQKNFVDKYIPIEAYEERNKTKLAEGRYKFMLGVGTGVLILSVFLAIFSLTL